MDVCVCVRLGCFRVDMRSASNGDKLQIYCDWFRAFICVSSRWHTELCVRRRYSGASKDRFGSLHRWVACTPVYGAQIKFYLQSIKSKAATIQLLCWGSVDWILSVRKRKRIAIVSKMGAFLFNHQWKNCVFNFSLGLGSKRFCRGCWMERRWVSTNSSMFDH